MAEFECVCTLATAIALKKIGLDIGKIGSGDTLQRLGDDPELLVNALYLICQKSVTDQGVSQEDFAASLGGDSLEFAVNAMWDSIASFSPAPQRAALKRIWTKTQELQAVQMGRVMDAIENLTTESISSESVGSSQESSAA